MVEEVESVARRHARGIVTQDPLAELPIGSSLAIEPISLGSCDATVQPQAVINWGFFDGAILALGFKDAVGLDIVGSAVMIAPGLAVTATHLMRGSESEIEAGSLSPYCVGVRDDDQLDIWRATSLSMDDGEIAFLSLELNSPISAGWRLRCVPVTTRSPSVGEPLTICGFRLPHVSSSGTKFVFSGEMLASAGTVQTVYTERRDSVLVTFPALEILCGSRGAMSGGAVFDASGHLVGIISTGMDFKDDDGPTNAAWIAPGLVRDVEVTWPPGLYPHSVRVANAIAKLQGAQYLHHTPDGGELEYWTA